MKRSNAPATMTAHAAKGMRSMTCGREDISSGVGGCVSKDFDDV